MSKKPNKKDNPRVIFKAFAASSLVSVIEPDINSEYDNIVLEFVEFSKGGTATKRKEIDYYFSPAEWLAFCSLIIDKSVSRAIKMEKAAFLQSGQKYCNTKMFEKMGGGNERVYKGNGENYDLVLKARSFYLTVPSSNNVDVMLVAEKCDGNKNKQGLIVPTGNNKEKVMVPVTFDTLLQMAVISQYRMQAYFTARQLRGDYSGGWNAEEGGEAAQSPQNAPQQSYQQNYQPDFYPQPEDAFSGGQEDADMAYYQQYAAQYSS